MCRPNWDPVPGVIKQPSCFCLCNGRRPPGANNIAVPRRLHPKTPSSTFRYPRRRRLLNGWPLAPGTDSSFKAVSLLPFVVVASCPGRCYLGAAIRTSRTAPSPGPGLYQLTFRGPHLAHNLMQSFSRHVSVVRAPMHGIYDPAQHPGRPTDAEQSTPLPSISLRGGCREPRRADGVGILYFPLVP